MGALRTFTVHFLEDVFLRNLADPPIRPEVPALVKYAHRGTLPSGDPEVLADYVKAATAYAEEQEREVVNLRFGPRARSTEEVATQY